MALQHANARTGALRRGLRAALVTTALALTLLPGVSPATAAQEDDWQYGAEELVTSDSFVVEEDSPYETDMIDPGTVSEPNPHLETEMIDPSAVSADTDGDGLVDLDEGTYGTNPSEPDSDGDGLGDGAEFHQHGTFPWAWDTEGDGLSDGDELLQHGSNPRAADTDGDGFADGFEVNEVGSDPTNPDSDGDGMLDGEDARPLR
jgi:hypothetical protein